MTSYCHRLLFNILQQIPTSYKSSQKPQREREDCSLTGTSWLYSPRLNCPLLRLPPCSVCVMISWGRRLYWMAFPPICQARASPNTALGSGAEEARREVLSNLSVASPSSLVTCEVIKKGKGQQGYSAYNSTMGSKTDPAVLLKVFEKQCHSCGKGEQTTARLQVNSRNRPTAARGLYCSTVHHQLDYNPP